MTDLEFSLSLSIFIASTIDFVTVLSCAYSCVRDHLFSISSWGPSWFFLQTYNHRPALTMTSSQLWCFFNPSSLIFCSPQEPINLDRPQTCQCCNISLTVVSSDFSNPCMTLYRPSHFMFIWHLSFSIQVHCRFNPKSMNILEVKAV